LLWDVLRAHDSLAHIADNYLGLETLYVEGFGARWREDTDPGNARVVYLEGAEKGADGTKSKPHLEALSGNSGFTLLTRLLHLEIKKTIGVIRNVGIKVYTERILIIPKY
jgi:hypothetical protein